MRRDLTVFLLPSIGVVLLAGSVGGQSRPTARYAKVFGEVRTLAGKPWVGVDVVLVSRPLPQNEDVGRQHEVRTKTDARGRFRTDLYRGMVYSAWAQAETAAGWRVSDVCPRAFAAAPVILEERAQALPSRTVEVSGCAAWQAHRPLRLRVVDFLGNRFVRWVALDDTGRATLPPLLGTKARLDLFATFPAGPVPLLQETLQPGERSPTGDHAAQPHPAGDVGPKRSDPEAAGTRRGPVDSVPHSPPDRPRGC